MNMKNGTTSTIILIIIPRSSAAVGCAVTTFDFGKDFVETVFRTLKTSEEMEPVRHRLENRARVYIFVCVLAYRLLAELQWRLDKFSERKGVWKDADAFIHDLERVERVEVRLGHQVKNWHLNLTGISDKTLEMIGFNLSIGYFSNYVQSLTHIMHKISYKINMLQSILIMKSNIYVI
jgi:hypothetical protein